MFQFIIYINVIMKTKYLTIVEGNLDEALHVAHNITEFENLYSKSVFEERLASKNTLILLAYFNAKLIGFKIGYETPSKQYFYSWMGGVISKYRKSGTAQSLIDYQEDWARKNKYIRILVKTRNKHLAMIALLEKNNYYRLGTEPFEPNKNTRIIYEKKL